MHLFENGIGDFLFRDRRTRNTGVGGITHEQGDADLTDISHLLIVTVLADRSQVELEVAGFNNSAIRRVDQYA